MLEFLHIYLVVIAAAACVTFILIFKVNDKKKTLDTGEKTVVEQYIEKKQLELERSRTNITLYEYFAMKMGFPAGMAVAAYFISPNRTLMLLFIAFGFILPNLFISMRKGNEDKKFTDRYVRALSQMASSLHSGMTVQQAVDSVAECELLHDSVREDFRTISAKMKLGVSIPEAFYEYAQKTENKDVYDTATAIDIMLTVGGQAGDAIEKILKNIEDRLLYRKKRESIMAESNIVALATDVMPLLTIALMYIVLPDLMSVYLEDTTYTVLFITMIGAMLLGSIVIRKMLKPGKDA